jgi:rhodanese-related sulfurtransferase
MDPPARLFSGIFPQAWVLLLAAAVPALVVAVIHPRRPAWSKDQIMASEVTWDSVQAWRGLVLLVDARAAVEFTKDHIPGALSLNEPQWEERLPDFIKAWQPSARVVVYCGSQRCGSSQAVARRLKRDLGIDGIFVLKGGWNAWIEARPQ